MSKEILRTLILNEHSKSQAILIKDYVGNNPARFDALIAHLIENEKVVAQRAAFSVMHILDTYPQLGFPYLTKLVEHLQIDSHPAVKRCIVRYFAEHEMQFSEEDSSLLIDVCFTFLNTHDTPVALKVYAMTVLFKFYLIYPELKGELTSSIESQLEYTEGGFLSRGRKLLKAIDLGKTKYKYL